MRRPTHTIRLLIGQILTTDSSIMRAWCLASGCHITDTRQYSKQRKVGRQLASATDSRQSSTSPAPKGSCSMSNPRKKPKLDFGAMVASCQTVNSQAEMIQQKCKAFALSCKAVADPLVMRTFSLCDQDTVEMMLVSMLGLDGLDSLRTAMQLVSEVYFERKVPNIVNKVLEQSGRDRLNEAQCSSFMSLCQLKCKQYNQRKVNPGAYDKEFLSLTHKHEAGHCAFLGPPTKHCLNFACNKQQLSIYIQYSH